MKEAGVGLMGLSLMMIVVGFLVSVSRSTGYGEVANLHAMHVQGLVFQGGFFAFLAGAILYAGGAINESIRAPFIPSHTDEPSKAETLDSVPPGEDSLVEQVPSTEEDWKPDRAWMVVLIAFGLLIIAVIGVVAFTNSEFRPGR